MKSHEPQDRRTATGPNDLGKKERRKRAYGVFVKEIQDHVSESGVAPVAVDQQQLLEIPETREGKVARHHRLQHARRTRHSASSFTPSVIKIQLVGRWPAGGNESLVGINFPKQ